MSVNRIADQFARGQDNPAPQLYVMDPIAAYAAVYICIALKPAAFSFLLAHLSPRIRSQRSPRKL